MSRLPRNTNPEYLRHISIRTERAQLLLQPDAIVNDIIGGIVAKYQEMFSIVLYAYEILGNHLHMLAKAPKRNLWRFEQAVNREIAKRINRLRNRQGHFWQRRYDEQIVPEQGDIIEAFLYVLCNAVSHGLVEHPALWPGLNCYAQVLDGKDRTFAFTNYTALNRARARAASTGEKVDIRAFQTQHVLRISPLPAFEHLTEKDRRIELTKLISQRVKRIQRERKQQGLGFLGRKAILRQRYSQVPLNVKHLPRPICYTKHWEVKKRFMERFFPWLAAYREASKKFRSGHFLVAFPPDSLMPPLHYSPSPT